MNRLTWIKDTDRRSKSKNKYAIYICVCGKEKEICKTKVNTNTTKSCGCLVSETMKQRKTTHNRSRSTEYKSWIAMKSRCLKKTHVRNKKYKDIKICSSWLQDFENFFRDMGEKPFKGASLERKNNKKGYNKNNCIWADYTTQNNNRSNVVLYNYLGEEKSLAELSREHNIKYSTLRNRVLSLNWDLEKALTRRTK